MSCISSAKFCQVAAAYKPSLNILLAVCCYCLGIYQNFKTVASNNISLHYWRDNNVLLLSLSAFCCYLTTLDGTVSSKMSNSRDNIVLLIILFERLCAVATWRNSAELLQIKYLYSIADFIILLLLSCPLRRYYLTEIGGTVSKMLKGRSLYFQ